MRVTRNMGDYTLLQASAAPPHLTRLWCAGQVRACRPAGGGGDRNLSGIVNHFIISIPLLSSFYIILSDLALSNNIPVEIGEAFIIDGTHTQ